MAREREHLRRLELLSHPFFIDSSEQFDARTDVEFVDKPLKDRPVSRSALVVFAGYRQAYWDACGNEYRDSANQVVMALGRIEPATTEDSYLTRPVPHAIGLSAHRGVQVNAHRGNAH